MTKLILYGVEASPPVRACKMTFDALGLPYEFKVVDMSGGEHKSKDYLSKNPQHTVPMLEDDGKFIWDSHAIMAYLVRKYGKDDALYPKDFYQRSIVDQRLHFESGILFNSCLRNIAIPIFYKNATTVQPEHVKNIHEAYEFLENFLDIGDYLAGSDVTIGDFSCISTVSSIQIFAPTDASKYPKLAAWMKRMAQLPNYMETNGKGAEMLIDMFRKKLNPTS